MDKLTKGTVTGIALATRIWVEERAQRANYNAHDLCGWCAIASAELHKRLEEQGIAAEIHMWQNETRWAHCFVVVDEHVVDITATQFRQFKDQNLVIMHVREAEAFEMYRTVKTFSCGSALRRHQKRDKWPSEQTCYG